MYNRLRKLLIMFLSIFYSKKISTILMYHSVGDNNLFFTVRVSEFEKQLDYLIKNNFEIVFLSTLVERLQEKKDNQKMVALTFDDGYLDNYENVFPLLKKYAIPASIFIITNVIGKVINVRGVQMQLLNIKEMEEMQKSGLVEFMPHTLNHPSLDKISFEEAKTEIVGSKEWIENNKLGNADIFAYPKGRFTKEIDTYIRDAGFKGVVTVNPGLVTMNSDLFLLPRNSIDSSVSFREFKLKCSRGLIWFTIVKNLFKK